MHLKFEKLKGEYALSSKRYELGENYLLDAHVHKIEVATSSEKYLPGLTNI